MQGISIMTRLGLFKLMIGLALFLMLGSFVDFQVQAQPMPRWAPDQKVPGYLNDTFTPLLIADRNRTVHAFVSQWIDDGGDRRQAIVYRKWSLAGGWTRPVDVILDPSGKDAILLGAYLDGGGLLHVAFSGGEGRGAVIYHSSAPVDQADSVTSWSLPEIIGTGILGLNSAALSGDGQSGLMLIYSGNLDGNGVYAISSLNQGKTWSEPIQVFLVPESNLFPYSLRLIPSSDGRQLRATWNMVTNLGVDEQLYFTSYDLTTKKWTKSIQLDQRRQLPEYFGPSFPVIGDTGSELVIMYNGGNPFTGLPVDVGRPVQMATVSNDGGLTWNAPSVPFPFHVGRSGEHTMAVDGMGVVHVLFIQRIENNINGKYTIIGGIWHSVFEGGSWSTPERFVTTYSPHDVRSVIVQGNVLLVAWREDPGEGQHGIWYSYLKLDSSELPVTPLPTINAPATTDTSLTAFPTPVFELPVPTNPVLTDLEKDSSGSTNPAVPLIVAVVVVLGVLVTAVVLYSLRTRA